MTFQLFIGQFATFFPLLVAAPRYFAGAISLGALTQIANAFWQVNASLSWFISNYTTFAEWRAAVDRLTEFSHEMAREAHTADMGARRETSPQDTIDLQAVCVTLPNGTPLLAPVTLRLHPHEAVLLQGPSGLRQEHPIARPRRSVAVRDRTHLPAGGGADAVPAAAALHVDWDLA